VDGDAEVIGEDTGIIGADGEGRAPIVVLNKF